MYGIQSDSKSTPSTADVFFFIDEKLYGTYTYTPGGTSNFTYDVLLFSVDSIPPKIHALRIENGRQNGGVSLLLLDYLVYTT